MGEIKEYTGIEKNGIVLYRLNEKLVPEGLVETRKVDHGDGSLGVTIASLTDRGTQVVGRILDDGETGPSLAEEVQILRAEVEDLRETVQMYEGHLDAAEERLDAVEDLADLRDEAEDAIERHEALVEEHRDALKALQDVKDANEVLQNVGLIERSSTDYWVKGPTALNFRHLWRYGVFNDLVNQYTPKSGASYGPGEAAVEEVDTEDLPVEGSDTPDW